MAVRTASVRNIEILRGPFDQAASGTDLRSVIVYFEIGRAHV